MKNKVIFLLFIMFLLILSACAPGNPPPTPAQAADTASLSTLVVPTANVLDVPTNTPQPIILPTVSPTPVILPTEVGIQPCVPHTDVSTPDLTGVPFSEFPAAFKDYLNAGGMLPALAELLYQSKLADRESLTPPVVEADLTGDGKADFIISVDDPERTFNPSPGALLIFTCWDDQFVFTHFEPSPNGLSTPAIVYIQDIDSDGVNELIVSSLQIGTHSLFEFMQILNWNGEQFLNQLYGVTGDLPFPQIQLVDFDGDGVYDLEVTSRGYGSVAAGPQRTLTRTWLYDAPQDGWLFNDEIPGFSTYRIHALHDADAAMQRGEYEIALLLYEQVFTDYSLADWKQPVDEQYALGAFARFKMVVAYTLLDQHQAAADMLAYLGISYPIDIPQHVYFDMADLFYNAYLIQGQGIACLAVQEYANANAEKVLYPLGADTALFPNAPLPFGYANSLYLPTGVCP